MSAPLNSTTSLDPNNKFSPNHLNRLHKEFACPDNKNTILDTQRCNETRGSATIGSQISSLQCQLRLADLGWSLVGREGFHGGVAEAGTHSAITALRSSSGKGLVTSDDFVAAPSGRLLSVLRPFSFRWSHHTHCGQVARSLRTIYSYMRVALDDLRGVWPVAAIGAEGMIWPQ